MTPLCIAEFERIDRHGNVDCIVEVDVNIDCDIDITGGPADDTEENCACATAAIRIAAIDRRICFIINVIKMLIR